MKNDGGPAFPCDDMPGYSGMCLRDYFAANAPPVPDWFVKVNNSDMEDLITWRWYYADALLAERDK